MTSKIFINYRRGDDLHAAGRLYDRIEQVFQEDALFMDVDNMPAGADFETILDKKVSECDVLLAVIGKNWLEMKDAEGMRRLDKPNDYVRIEIASALRLGKRIIPVLVNGADMPAPEVLPELLKPLSRRHAVRLTNERFKADAQGLVNGLKTALAEAEAERAARTEAERRAAEEARKKREAAEEARAAELEREKAERARKGLTPDEIRRAEELANWDFIKESRNAGDFRDHLARFAGGSTERFARTKLEALIWAEPATQASIEALRTFIEEFPKGDNTTAALARIEALEKKRAAARLEEEKRHAETEAWAKVAGSTSIFEIDDFLRTWPSGAHAKNAKEKKRQLRGSFFVRNKALSILGGLLILVIAASLILSQGPSEKPTSQPAIMPDYEAKAKAEREEIIADTRRKVKETIDQQQRNMEREMFGR